MIIKSSQNKIVKQLSALKQKKERDKTLLFTVEGERIVKEIPNQWDVSYYAVSESYFNSFSTKEFKKRADVFVIDDSLFQKTADTVTPQGVIAVCSQRSFDINEILNRANPLIVMLENLSDPGNTGTLIRTADAAGADCVILSKGSVDLYNPKVIRSTMGSVFHLPIITGANLFYVTQELKKHSIKLYAAHLKGEKSLYAADMKGGCAILIGNEANGLSDEISQEADMLVKIPMPGKAESMNASAAGSIIIYEALRQRLL